MISVRAGLFRAKHYRYRTPYGERVDYWIDDSVAPIGLIKLEAEQKQHSGFPGGFKFELVAMGSGAIPQVTKPRAPVRRARSSRARDCRGRATHASARNRRRRSFSSAPPGRVGRNIAAMRRAPVALSLVICLGGAACGPNLPDRLWRSEHVRYFTRAGDDSVCPAMAGQVEEHARVIGDALGIETPLVTYYKYPDEVDFDAYAECDNGTWTCAQNATVRSTVAFDRRGLIHAYLAPYGLPPRLFVEGAAVALSCQHYPRPMGSWRDALTR